jgi:uncharacterized protein YegL
MEPPSIFHLHQRIKASLSFLDSFVIKVIQILDLIEMDDSEESQVRRLPVYLLIDCSRSMRGNPIQAMEMGLQALLHDLKEDPVCLESVWLSVIVFGSAVELLLPLSDLDETEIPRIHAEGATCMGEAIKFAQDQISEEVRNTTADRKGDWKPMVFLFTDGEPTDEWEDQADQFKQSGEALIVACGAGPEVNDEVLERIGDHALHLHDTQPGTLTEFMDWVSQSVTARSHCIGTGGSRANKLSPPPDDSILIK